MASAVPLEHNQSTPTPADAPCAGGMQAFFIPSVFGDEPHLVDLRDRLRGCLALDLVALPDAGARGAILTDMQATGRGVADEILRRQPTGPLALIGYSFGASVALEVAAQLTRAGRTIAFLGILDGPFSPPDVSGTSGGTPHPAASRQFVKAVVVEATESMNILRRIALTAAPTAKSGFDVAQPMRRAILWHLRNKALVGWTPPNCDAKGLHVSTGAYGADNARRWRDLCPNLACVDVPSAHEHLLHGASLDAVVAALTRATERVRATRT